MGTGEGRRSGTGLPPEEAARLFAGMPNALARFREAEAAILALGPVVERVTRTQVSFSSNAGFAWLWPPVLHKRGWPRDACLLTFGLARRVEDPRIAESVEPYPGRFTHHVLLARPEDLDAAVLGWIAEACAFGLARRRGRPYAPGRTVVPDPEATLVVEDAAAWGDWLAANHAASDGVWLRIRKVRRPGPGVLLEEAIAEAVRYGWIDSVMHPVDADGFRLRFTPRRPGGRWSQRMRACAEALEAEGRLAPAGLAEVRAARADGRWDAAYTSRVRPAVPPDLAAALDATEGARERFGRWTASRQLQHVVRIEEAKRAETRAKRIAAVLAALAEGP